MRQQLIDFYLDYVNNFLTVTAFAEYHGLLRDDAIKLLAICKGIYEANHPEG